MRSNRARSAWRRRRPGPDPISLEISVELPNQRANLLLCQALLIGERIQLMDQPLGVNPAQRVRTNRELAGLDRGEHQARSSGREDSAAFGHGALLSSALLNVF